MDTVRLKDLFRAKDPNFWPVLAELSAQAADFDLLLQLSTLRRKAERAGIERPNAHLAPFRVAIVGAYSLYPFSELLTHLCETSIGPCEIWSGAYDNYVSEIMEADGELYRFQPDCILVLPSAARCAYSGSLADSREVQEQEACAVAQSLIALGAVARERANAEVFIANYPPPTRHDLGPFRTRSQGSEWSFRKRVNLELGLSAPTYLHICDLEYLVTRIGSVAASDDRGWFQSKQIGAPLLVAELAREFALMIAGTRKAPKKVLVCDLDNTLWGGVIGDDGLEGIEIGDTSPRGEAYKAFQKYIKSLQQRGVLLAVCSKNEMAKATEPFEKHPEMVLQMSDFVAFKANWEPKSENIRQIAAELNLSLDSFVFIDDNPAEIEIVRQFVPEVSAIPLGDDPSTYLATLQDCRLLEPKSITQEDLARTSQYQSEVQRKALAASATDMNAYLESLEMRGRISEFVALDVPRLSQLINKSNQFNLTTRRYSEADVREVMEDPQCVGFSVRLSDRFGDHGLISVLVAKPIGTTLEIDTWLMSCRVLKRQVEDEALNELTRLARLRGCTMLRGRYIPTAKNEMVRDFYTRMGFTLVCETPEDRVYELDLNGFASVSTKIYVEQRSYESA